MENSMRDIILVVKTPMFVIDLIIHYILLLGVLWSVLSYKNRIWPPPKKQSWQYTFTWLCYYAAFVMNGIFIFLDWDSWLLTGYERFLIGAPLVMVGIIFLLWGIKVLGVKNTSGLKSGFIRTGPYRFTRNPQYLGDIILFIGIIIVSNSVYLFILNSLLVLVFLIAPLVEEIWLEDNYGDLYLEYKRETSRFL